MVDGAECLCEVEVDLVHHVSFVHQTGYTFFLKEKIGQAGSAGRNSCWFDEKDRVSWR